MPELWPGARVEVRVPQPPRVVVEQPVPAATVIYSPAAQWRAAIAALQADIADETTRAESAESALSTALGLETTARQLADTALDARVTTAESTLASLPATYVPQTTQVNGHALSGNVTVSKSDLGLTNADLPTVILQGTGIDLTGATDSTSAIQALLTAAASLGARVRAVDGATYKITELAVTNAVGMTVEGSGVTFIGTDDTKRPFTFTNPTSLTLRGSVTIKHQNHASRTVGYGVFITGGDQITVEGWTVRDLASAGILIQNSTRVKVRGCTVRDNLADGIHITGGCADVAINGNTLTQTGDDAIAVVSYDADANPVQRVAIAGNTIYQSKARGVAVVGGEKVTISGNTVQATKVAGIYVAQEDAYATRQTKNITVSGNTVIDANTYDSPSSSAPGIYVVGGNASKPVSNVTVSGNTVTGAAYRGIGAAAGAANACGVISVVGNHIISNGASSGIEFSAIATGWISGNNVHFAYGNGIFVDTSSDTIGVVSNRVYKPNQGSASGIYGVNNGSTTGLTGPNYVTADGTKTTLTAQHAASAGAGTVNFAQNVSVNQLLTNAATRSLLIGGVNGNAIAQNTGGYQWVADTNVGAGTIDTGLARSAAGIVKLTNGSTGGGAIQPGNTSSAGARIWSGSGAPSSPGGSIAYALGDCYLRTDTPSTANQRLYMCTTAGTGGAAVWTGVL